MRDDIELIDLFLSTNDFRIAKSGLNLFSNNTRRNNIKIRYRNLFSLNQCSYAFHLLLFLA